MTIRNVLIAGALIAALPAVSNAANHDSMTAACGRAFAAQLGVADGVTPGYKLAQLNGDSESAVERFYSASFVLDMVAHSAKTGAVIAKASCVVRRDGTVIALNAAPLSTSDVRVAQR